MARSIFYSVDDDIDVDSAYNDAPTANADAATAASAELSKAWTHHALTIYKSSVFR